ncbi:MULTISPECIES: PaaI family thioesterase [unclassified Sphingomonas]|uniref:PaaI family thioesterase n=1 Tax=unclassified Sphingomonas TaxID=196159 RepID=UPI0006F4DA9D|nr:MULTISPECIES: PaaI family thioesterase [unclassified Sphingomonas]KQX21564.1 thioesterase [Sphingomonas sp. Root1294]KQY72881.1 thioesterase [Sphingomonas sp. Root50]KRB88326.1 thioesterase [Sphingomonas sp. Root720]
MSSLPPLQFDLDGLAAFIDESFPARARPALGRLVTIAPGHARLLLEPDEDMVRPGGIVSGPVLMGLVDVAAWAAVLAHVGPVAMAVTHSLNMAFLRACAVAPVTADARLLRLGRRLATIDVRLWQESEDRLVAQSTVGYALP